nr:hypothetical protein [Desulfobacula sp.]
MKTVHKTLIAMLVFFILSTGWVSAGTNHALFIHWRGQTPCDAGLREGLKELGITLNIEEFDADQDNAKLDAFLSSLDEKKYDFIYTFGTTVSKKTAEKVKNTPILFGIVTTPVESGLIKSWENSGNNVTGVSPAIPIADQLDFILTLGKFSKIGMIFNPKEANSENANKDFAKYLGAKGIAYTPYPVESENDIPAVVAKTQADKVGLIYLPSDSFITTQADKITAGLSGSGIPSYGATEVIVQKGAMIGIVSSYHTVGKELSLKAAEILKGKKPSEIPSNILPVKLQTVLVNGKTVEKIKVEIPYSILSKAKIIE